MWALSTPAGWASSMRTAPRSRSGPARRTSSSPATTRGLSAMSGSSDSSSSRERQRNTRRASGPTVATDETETRRSRSARSGLHVRTWRLIRRRDAGDQPRAAPTRHEAEHPPQEHEQPVLEADQVVEVDDEPRDPGHQAAEANDVQIGDGAGPADRREVALVEVVEGLG